MCVCVCSTLSQLTELWWTLGGQPEPKVTREQGGGVRAQKGGSRSCPLRRTGQHRIERLSNCSGSGDQPTVSHVVDREWEFQESLSGKLPGEGGRRGKGGVQMEMQGEEVWGGERQIQGLCFREGTPRCS